MNKVRINKKDLLKKIIQNRDNHKRVVDFALEGYRKAVIERLEEAISDAKAGLRINTNIELVQPMDYTKEYNKVIKMLEMSADKLVELTGNEFSCYVMDDWGWKDQWIHSNALYTTSALSA